MTEADWNVICFACIYYQIKVWDTQVIIQTEKDMKPNFMGIGSLSERQSHPWSQATQGQTRCQLKAQKRGGDTTQKSMTLKWGQVGYNNLFTDLHHWQYNF